MQWRLGSHRGAGSLCQQERKSLAILAEIRQEVRRIARAELETSTHQTSTHVHTMDSLEEFDREELRLGDEEAFKTLVLRLVRIGGKDTKECVHNVLNRLMSNWLMTKFNLRGSGGKKRPFIDTALFRATKDAVLQAQPTAKEEEIKHMTNGGKSTLASSLHQKIPNSCIIAQDAFFKDDSVVPVDRNGFKQYDVLEALHMDRMMMEVELWRRDPGLFLVSRGLRTQRPETPDDQGEVSVLIVEGFLIFNYRPLNKLMDMRYFLEIPYEICRERRCSRVYTPPDPPGYFDGHVWPMYVKNRKEMEDISVSGIGLLDGLRTKEELLASVYEDVTKEVQSLMGKD